MTPKQKAKELVLRMQSIPSKKCEKGKIHFLVMKQTAILQALIAVDEILKCAFYTTDEIYDYYHEVKLEIEKL